MRELMEISERVTYDPTKKFQNLSNPLGDSGIDMKGILNEIEEDKGRMMKELA